MIHAQVHRTPEGEIGELKISVTSESLPSFIQMVNRALNCWDNAPKDLKDLGDLITHNRITQDHTLTKINTNQNSEYYTSAERAMILKYITDHGQEAWIKRISMGTTGAVLKGTATD